MATGFETLPIEEGRRAVVRLGMRAANAYMAQGMYSTMETTLRRVANGTLRSIANGRAARTSFAAGFGMSDMAALITSDTTQAMSPGVARLAELFTDSLSSNMNRKVGLLQVHQQAALASQEAVREAYVRLVLNKQTVASYREGQGRLPFKMAEALERPDFNQANVNGVAFGNVGMLDAVAAHWYRLNFGAGQRGATTPNPEVFSVKFFGQAVGSIRLGGGPSAPFFVPPGLFVNGSTVYGFDASRRGMDAFYLPSMAGGLNLKKAEGSPPKNPVMSQGIVGRRFLDAGIGVLANTLPYLYEQKIRDWLMLAGKDAGRRGPFAVSLEQSEAISLQDSAIAARHANQFLQM